MKNYKYLIPLLLIVLTAAGYVSLVNNSLNTDKEYEGYLKEARRLADLDVVEDSAVYYNDALALNESLDIELELAQMYHDHEWPEAAVSQGETIVEQYPKEADAYIFLFNCYVEEEDYESAFELYDQASGYGVESKELKKIYSAIEYTYQYGWDYYDEVGEAGDGYIPVKVEDLWGYANLSGELKIKAQFKEAGPFSLDEVAAVVDQDGEYYYIATSGNKKIAVQNLTQVSALSLTSNSVLAAADNGVYGYYDFDFNKVIDAEYNYATIFNGDIAAVENGDGWSLINTKGEVVTKETYDWIRCDGKGIAYRNDRAFVQKDNSWYMIDGEGNQIGDTGYEDCQIFFEADGLAAVKVDGLWGFVDKDGKMVVEPAYQDARSTKNGFAAVKTDNGLWGYITNDGEQVIDSQFEDAREFNESGNAFVETDGTWRMILLYKYQ